MRRIAWALTAATLLAIVGCDSGSTTTNTGPALQKNPKGPGPMKPPSEGGSSLPPGKK